MNKLISVILICIMSMFLCAFPSYGEETIESIVDWRGDYTDSASPKIIVTIDSAVKYNQRVTVSMYEENVASPTFIDYKRMDEVFVKGNDKLEIAIPIGDDLNYKDSDGNRHYKLKLKGNGLNADNVNKVFDVYILTPNDINGDNGVLAKINNSQTIESLRIYLSNVLKALRIDSTAITDTRLMYFLSTKNADFSNGFNTVSDIDIALKVSELIEYLRSDSATPSEVKKITEKYDKEVNINTLDPDYIAYTSAIYEDVCSIKNTFLYNNVFGISSGKALKSAIEQYQALHAINALTEVNEKARTTVPKYYAALGITDEYVTKFNTMSSNNSSDADKVLRVICDATFLKPSDIEVKFRETIDGILNPPGDSGNGGNEGTGGSGGSGGAGGPSYSIQDDTVVAPQVKTEFKDCSESFWAYSYICDLQEKNIISGYADGNFYPSNKVTREEFVKMIILSVGLFDSASECDFVDVSKNDWHYRYVASAVNSGIINGIDVQSFGTGKYITRENMAVIAARILSRFNKAATVHSNQFTDQADISDYAVESVNMLAGMQILSGFEDGSIRPKENLTRAEAAKIIWMVMKTV